MDDIASGTPKLNDKIARLRSYTCWEGVPEDRLEQISRLGVVIDDMVDEYRLDCIALRCWVELQAQLGISPCVLLSEMNDRGIAASCEVDVGNAVAMHALKLATGQPATCLDWNNNFAEDRNKCVCTHCGNFPKSFVQNELELGTLGVLGNVLGLSFIHI